MSLLQLTNVRLTTNDAFTSGAWRTIPAPLRDALDPGEVPHIGGEPVLPAFDEGMVGGSVVQAACPQLAPDEERVGEPVVPAVSWPSQDAKIGQPHVVEPIIQKPDEDPSGSSGTRHSVACASACARGGGP